MENLEIIAQELLDVFNIVAPPVHIEMMLRSPKEGMWEKVDVTQLSGSFLTAKGRYSPRMSMARLLARHIAYCEWGNQRNVRQEITTEEQVQAFARMLIMPRKMVHDVANGTPDPSRLSIRFEVPEEDARHRIEELFTE